MRGLGNRKARRSRLKERQVSTADIYVVYLVALVYFKRYECFINYIRRYLVRQLPSEHNLSLCIAFCFQDCRNRWYAVTNVMSKSLIIVHRDRIECNGVRR